MFYSDIAAGAEHALSLASRMAPDPIIIVADDNRFYGRSRNGNVYRTADLGTA
jgi:hypothetical protein